MSNNIFGGSSNPYFTNNNNNNNQQENHFTVDISSLQQHNNDEPVISNGSASTGLGGLFNSNNNNNLNASSSPTQRSSIYTNNSSPNLFSSTNNSIDEPTAPNANTTVEGNNDSNKSKFDLQMLNHTRERLWSVLESQAGVMSFLLYVAFSFSVTGAVDWSVSFPCFALVARMVIHAVVVVMASRHSDLFVSFIGLFIIIVCLPFFTTSSAAAGIFSYILLTLPFYAEQSLKNQTVKEAIDESGAKVGLWRKRGAQLVQLIGPVSVGIFSIFSLQGGFFFHIAFIIVVWVYVAGHVIRALEMKKFHDAAYAAKNGGAAHPSTTIGANSNNAGVQVLEGVGIMISPARVVMDRVTDAPSMFVQAVQEHREKVETNISQSYPQIYKYYLHLPKSYTAAVCTFLIFVLLVTNVATYAPMDLSASGGAPANNSKPSAPSTPSSPSPSDQSPTPAPPTPAPPTAAPTSAPTPAPPTGIVPPVYAEHYYVSAGLLASFLMASVELLVDAFLPTSSSEVRNEVDQTENSSSNNNNNNSKGKNEDGDASSAAAATASSASSNEQAGADSGDEPCCQVPEAMQAVTNDLRYRRFALLAFTFILAFLPMSLRIYPAALALASYVPWIVWRDSCGKFITTLFATRHNSNNNNTTTDENNVNNSNNNIQQDGQGNVMAEHAHNNVGAVATNEEEANRRQEQNVAASGRTGASIEDFINERVIADFFLPTIVTGLLLLLASGAEEKRPSHFLSFIAITLHGAMAYFLYFSLKQNLGDGSNRNEYRHSDDRQM